MNKKEGEMVDRKAIYFWIFIWTHSEGLHWIFVLIYGHLEFLIAFNSNLDMMDLLELNYL